MTLTHDDTEATPIPLNLTARVTEYRVIRSWKGPGDLNGQAAELIADGWQPFGAVSCATGGEDDAGLLSQAFVRYAP